MMRLPYEEIIFIRILYEEKMKSDVKFIMRLTTKFIYKILSHRSIRELIWAKDQHTHVYKHDIRDFAEFALASSPHPDINEIDFYGIHIIRTGGLRYLLDFVYEGEHYKIDTYEPLDEESKKFYEEHPIGTGSNRSIQREYVEKVCSNSSPYHKLIIDAVIKFMKGIPNDD